MEPVFEPYQKRVVAEKLELDAKLQALRNFIASGLFPDLDPAERQRLMRQEELMSDYSGVLRERIAAFKGG